MALYLSIKAFVLFSFTPFYFVHYSDPQIGRNVYAIPNCSLAVYQIGNLSPPPGFIIVCGDMAEDPTDTNTLKTQWRICDSLFDILTIPKYFTPGNRDVGYASQSCWTPAQLSLYRRVWGSDYYSFDYDSCHFIGLNSTLLDTYSGHPCYPFSLEQDSFLRTDLATITPQRYLHNFIFFHFPLYVSYATEPNSNNNVDRPRRDTILNALVNKNFTAVFTGHLHYELMNFYNYTLLQSGPSTSETNINQCGYRLVKVFRNGIETFAVWLNAPLTNVSMAQIVTPAISTETTYVNTPVGFSCIVDSVNFPQWTGLSYLWRFGDSQTSNQPNTSHSYQNPGEYLVNFTAYKTPSLCAVYRFRILVLTYQTIKEDNDKQGNRLHLPTIIENSLKFQFLSDAGKIEFSLYSADGREVFCKTQPQEFAIPDYLPAGIYFFRLYLQDSVKYGKFIKIR